MLGEVCNVQRGTMITQAQARPGLIPVVAGGIAPTYFHDVPNRSGGTITISASGANAGFVNFWDQPIFASDCSTVTASRHEVDIRFMYHQLLSKQHLINGLRAGAAQPHVYAKDIAKLIVKVPPVSEQRRIIAILDKADALRTKRREALAQLDRLAQSIFIEMFGDPVTNPKGWPRVNLGELIAGGPQNGLYKPASSYGSGVPILRIDGFYDGEVTGLTTLKRLRIEAKDIGLYGLNENDIVINRVNSPEYLGKSALIPPLPEPVVFESNMMRFVLKTERVIPRYVIAFLQSGFIKAQIRIASKDAVNQSSINQQDVKSFLINLPPLRLQQTFADRLAEAGKLRLRHAAAISEAGQLFASLQHRAFHGEL